MKKLLTLFLCCFLAITVTTVEAGIYGAIDCNNQKIELIKFSYL